MSDTFLFVSVGQYIVLHNDREMKFRLSFGGRVNHGLEGVGGNGFMASQSELDYRISLSARHC